MMNRVGAIAAALLVAILGSAAFIAAYFAGGDRLYEGLALAVTAAAFCVAAVGWAFWIIPDEQVVDEVDTYPCSPADRAEQSSEVSEGLREVTRSRALVALLGAALGSFAAALILPIRSLGLAPGNLLFHTRWRRGARIVRDDGTFVHVDDLNVDTAVTVFPEGATQDPQSVATLLRVPSSISGTAGGYMAYSRLCTHAGCPVALYRASEHHLICPCHQSAFDALANGAVISGPADHALPRLPIEIGSDGILRATGDFPEPVGPGFWERG
jgi:quinol---cytochrome c reductase iron-sulfur subunit